MHNHNIARQLLGHAPLILCGHSHTAMMGRKGQSLFINAGSIGTAGVRYFTEPQLPPYSAVILTFTAADRPQLRYVDFIKIEQAEGNFIVQRRDLLHWKHGHVFHMR